MSATLELFDRNKIISVAPMMDCTDRHDRYFLRLIAPDVELYSEMITTYALIHGDVNYLLGFDPAEKYVALQLGGSDAAALAHCAKLGEDYGYNEINLNVGCPSPRVSSGRFGACLMLEPELVAECLAAMRERVDIPVTVKCRIGVDDKDSYDSLRHFIQCISNVGISKFIIHARKAWLNGLSPKENREIPPLQYDVVKRLKMEFPQLTIIINGGFKTIDEIDAQLPDVDGVMFGRAAYANPYLLAQIQQKYFAPDAMVTRHEVIQQFIPYVENQLAKKVRLQAMTRHILGLFQGQRGAANWRRFISENAHKPGAGVEVIEQALALVS
jgi:tRNA-dihydrouridine synthase A